MAAEGGKSKNGVIAPMVLALWNSANLGADAKPMQPQPRRGERLDLYLVRSGIARSRRTARELIQKAAISVNGRSCVKGLALEPADRVEISSEIRMSARLVPNPSIALEILHVDASVIVVNKPAPMPCHPLRSDEDRTVMNGIAALFPETALFGDSPLEGGLVHRLDNGTSGALLVARNAASLAHLRGALRSGIIERRYEALVTGNPPPRMELRSRIAHHPKNAARMVAVGDTAIAGRARPALTSVEVIERFKTFTLISVIPATGCRHQIRVHLASAGFSVVGDRLYGGLATEELAPERFYLHLRRLRFASLSAGDIVVEARLPADLSGIIARLINRRTTPASGGSQSDRRIER